MSPLAIEPPRAGDALVIVDVQRDFVPGGALAVRDGDAVVPVLSGCALAFAEAGLPIYASRDWHPADHCSFRAKGGPWPPHCVANTRGAEFADLLVLPPGTHVVSKGTRPDADAYSAFDHTNLAVPLGASGVRRLWVGGLATDYCVRASVLDALAAGFEVIVLTDAVRAVDVQRGDGARALDEMTRAGARLHAGGLPAA
jgi:nicotinamidase/pyrazinamidase